MNLILYQLGVGFALGVMSGRIISILTYSLKFSNSLFSPKKHYLFCKSIICRGEEKLYIDLIQKQKNCSKSKPIICIRSTLIELTSGILFLSCNFANSNQLFETNGLINLFSGWVFSSILLTLTVLDIENFWLPREISLLGIILGFFLIILNCLLYRDLLITKYILNHLTALLIGYISFEITRKLCDSIIKSPSLGKGDSILVGLLGLWLGLYGLYLTITFAFISAGLIVLSGRISKHFSRGEVIPFGPFLSFYGFIIWLTGSDFWIDLFSSINETY